jgi:hypothetical protein
MIKIDPPRFDIYSNDSIIEPTFLGPPEEFSELDHTFDKQSLQIAV